MYKPWRKQFRNDRSFASMYFIIRVLTLYSTPSLVGLILLMKIHSHDLIDYITSAYTYTKIAINQVGHEDGHVVDGIM